MSDERAPLGATQYKTTFRTHFLPTLPKGQTILVAAGKRSATRGNKSGVHPSPGAAVNQMNGHGIAPPRKGYKFVQLEVPLPFRGDSCTVHAQTACRHGFSVVALHPGLRFADPGLLTLDPSGVR